MLTLVFGLPAAGALHLNAEIMHPATAAGIAFLCSVICAALWRRLGVIKTNRLLRFLDISREDGAPSVWRSMIEDEEHTGTQLYVLLKNGNTLICRNLAKYKDAPFGPCLYGADGSVAMYVEASQHKDREDIEYGDTLTDENWGSLLTFIPADEIARVIIRTKHFKPI